MTPIIEEVKLSEIVFDEVIYPRKDHDPDLVQRYVGVLDEIEAKQRFMSVAADNKLLDGKHRWLAYRTKHQADGDPIIKIFRYPVTAPHDQLKLAARLNSEHGWQLTEDDKQKTAISLFAYGCRYDEIVATLSVGKKQVSDWLSKTVKEQKERRNVKIFDLWLACHTQEEIADATKEPLGTIGRLLADEEFLHSVLENQTKKLAAEHATEFEPPIYNIWTKAAKTEGSDHFGNTEVTLVDNLLYLYTKPFDVVIDPFAGGGSTINICKKRFRRYWVGDRNPPPRLETAIRKHDLVTDGIPKPPQWKDVTLVYLDPPYWRQAAGKYSDDATDLANMELAEFNEKLAGIINGFARKLTDAFIALIIQPTQWNAPNREFTDHVREMLRRIDLEVDMRFSAPYSTEQHSPQMVEWAKANRRCLVLTRELIVWRV